MTGTSGTADQILSLPQGGGAVQGLGETFQPDFHTGTGSYAVPLDIPNGPNDIAPKLTLLYSTASGNGPFGMGFALNLLTIGRSTDRRVPTYTADDPLVLHGGGELVDVGGGRLRLRNETNGWHFQRVGEGFEITDAEGKVFRLGRTEQARRIVDAGGSPKVLDWLLEEIEDPLGHLVRYGYRTDGGQLYLARVDYGPFTVSFSYEERPDPLTDGRSGVLISTALRCTRVELSLADSPTPLVRRWDLGYGTSSAGHSLLEQITLTGFDPAGVSATLPVLTLGYTQLASRRLERFQAASPDAAPDARLGTRRELIDWTGDGLPDLLELGGGRGRVWPNLGHCTWGRPTTLAGLPAPVALDEPGVTFADMEGNGTADLLMLDRGLTGYYPHRARSGFDRPVFWERGPGARLSDPDARMVDLDGDGITDLLVTGDRFFQLYLRDGAHGWREHPVNVPRPEAPPVALRDPRVHLADMNGDGFQDLVRVDGGGVTYWPYLGLGSWDAAVVMADPPTLPARFDPARLFLSDVDGDGCADLVYVDGDRVLLWLNGGGTRLSDPIEIRHTPQTRSDQIRMADMRGGGTPGVLWSCPLPGRRGTEFFYLDLVGGTKPYLLNRIDNGMGLVTEIEYGSSTEESVRDRGQGRPWSTFLPFTVPVVTATTAVDQATGRTSHSDFRYHQGHFDGVGREFSGFQEVEIEELGDSTAPTLLTRNHYHLGLDPDDLERSLPENERIRLRTLRGKLLRAEVFGLDGDPDQDRPYTRTESRWDTVVLDTIGDIEIHAPRQLETVVTALERQLTPYRVTIDRNLTFDPEGNVTSREQIAEDPRDASLRRVLRTESTYASDAVGRFRGKPVRTIQRDGDGTIVSAGINYYDGRPEGQVGGEGLLTRLECLVLTDETVTVVHGAPAPDFAAIGYHRRPGETGWWIDQLRYSRTDDADGLRGRATNALGHAAEITFDTLRTHPVRLVDPLGNTSVAEFDQRANKIRSLTDASGAVMTNGYDPLGRLVFTVEPGADASLPTEQYGYATATVPVSVSTAQRVVNGRAAVLTSRSFYDGLGHLLEERRTGSGGEVCERATLYSSRGLVRAQFLPRPATTAEYVVPADDLPHQTLEYDAIGRLVGLTNADGSTRRQRYEPGAALTFDEEDGRPGGTHANTPTRLVYDPTGRLATVVVDAGGTRLETRYEYDVKGNVLAVIGADGLRSSFDYDLLGHRIRTASPSSGTTRFVFDANGNLVERQDARHETVAYAFDPLDRLTRVSFPDTGVVTAEYHYHDQNPPAPAEAGPFSKGRLVKVVHQGGTETYEYDALGRVSAKTVAGPGPLATGLRFDYTYRADGLRDTVTYPTPTPGGGRMQVNHEYDGRGLLLRIPNFVRRIDYNPAGQRTRVEYANDVVATYTYDPLTMRLNGIRTVDPAGTVLQEFSHEYDRLGNLVSVVSPDPLSTMTYAYDDLYRLTAADRGDGQTWSYDYDVVGNLTAKSDIGAFSYDAVGRLTTAGADTFSYTPAGQTTSGPWGTGEYDASGRLHTITAGAARTSYTYDHHGRRVREQVDGGATDSDRFTPDDRLTIEDGVFIASIVDGGARVAQLRLDTGAIGFLHGDHLGSTTLVTGPAGEVLQRVRYDPFGAVLVNAVTAGADGTRYLYTGAEHDPGTGLVHLHARYYDPRYGRFLTGDTLVPNLHEPQAWNRYSYVQNNPLRFVDPTGHFWEEIGDWFEDNWQAVVAVLVIIAVVVLTVVTFGVGGLVAVGIGMAIGGAIGGISAGIAGGDILQGILVGMAVGGLAGFAGLGIGAGMAAAFGKGTLAAVLLTGTLSGAVTGAAMGFAAGYAGGVGNAATIWDRMWKGALVGAITGLAFSGLSYAFQHSAFGPKLPTSLAEVKQGIVEAGPGVAKGAGEAGTIGIGDGVKLGIGAVTGSGNTGGYWLSPLLGGGSVLGSSSVAAWQVAAVGLTSSGSGVFVLDWADDLWEWAVGEGFVKYEKSGSW